MARLNVARADTSCGFVGDLLECRAGSNLGDVRVFSLGRVKIRGARSLPGSPVRWAQASRAAIHRYAALSACFCREDLSEFSLALRQLRLGRTFANHVDRAPIPESEV